MRERTSTILTVVFLTGAIALADWKMEAKANRPLVAKDFPVGSPERAKLEEKKIFTAIDVPNGILLTPTGLPVDTATTLTPGYPDLDFFPKPSDRSYVTNGTTYVVKYRLTGGGLGIPATNPPGQAHYGCIAEVWWNGTKIGEIVTQWTQNGCFEDAPEYIVREVLKKMPKSVVIENSTAVSVDIGSLKVAVKIQGYTNVTKGDNRKGCPICPLHQKLATCKPPTAATERWTITETGRRHVLTAEGFPGRLERKEVLSCVTNREVLTEPRWVPVEPVRMSPFLGTNSTASFVTPTNITFWK